MNHTFGTIYFAAFLAFLLGVAIWSSRENKNGSKDADEEYFL